MDKINSSIDETSTIVSRIDGALSGPFTFASPHFVRVRPIEVIVGLEHFLVRNELLWMSCLLSRSIFSLQISSG